MRLDRRETLDAAIAAAAADAPEGTRLLAIGWSTVESERAEAELGGVFTDAPADVLLGATCRLGRDFGPVPVLVLEPSTEGRLAGSLARLGEGPAVAWYVLATSRSRSAATPSAGPLGPETLVRDGPGDGRVALLVGTGTGTILDMTDATADRPAVTLRAATPADADAIASLFTDEGYPTGSSDIVTRLGRFASPHSRVVVAEHEGALIGFIAVHAMPRFEHDDRILRILALVVDAGARERGVGRTLMAEAERVGSELGAAFVEITAGHHRPEARHLYESLGYDATVTAYLRKKL